MSDRAEAARRIAGCARRWRRCRMAAARRASRKLAAIETRAARTSTPSSPRPSRLARWRAWRWRKRGRLARRHELAPTRTTGAPRGAPPRRSDARPKTAETVADALAAAPARGERATGSELETLCIEDRFAADGRPIRQACGKLVQASIGASFRGEDSAEPTCRDLSRCPSPLLQTSSSTSPRPPTRSGLQAATERLGPPRGRRPGGFGRLPDRAERHPGRRASAAPRRAARRDSRRPADARITTDDRVALSEIRVDGAAELRRSHAAEGRRPVRRCGLGGRLPLHAGGSAGDPACQVRQARHRPDDRGGAKRTRPLSEHTQRLRQPCRPARIDAEKDEI